MRSSALVLVAMWLVSCSGQGTVGPIDVLTSSADVSVLGSDAAGPAQQDIAVPTPPDVTTTPDTSVTDDVAPEPDTAPSETCGDGNCTDSESCESCVEDCPVCAPAAGAMVITEIMKDPDAVADSQGEWIELVNVSDAPIDLNGMTLRDSESDAHVIDSDSELLVAPGEYVVLGVTADLGVGLVADYVVSGFYLDNDADEVILVADGVVLDQVAYDDTQFVDPTGASLQLHGGEEPDATTNDSSGAWCAGTTPYGSGDFGTPGEQNTVCDVCGDGACGVTEECDACIEDCGACTPCDQGGQASDEYCNGVDDDCDGDIDESTCGDFLGCTDDVCIPGEGCVHIPAAGGCAVDGYCVSDGAYNPLNPCQVCDEETSQVQWTEITSGPCNDGDTCTTSDICVLGQCEGNPIQDSFEHNDTKSVATQIGGIGDGADWPAGQINGASLFGPGDVDWFKYTVSDDWLGSFAPRADLVQVPSQSSYEICLYMLCDDGKELELKSCEAGEESSSDGMEGCCATDSVQLEVNCDGSSESGTLYVKVTHKSGDWTCDHYAFEWGDD